MTKRFFVGQNSTWIWLFWQVDQLFLTSKSSLEFVERKFAFLKRWEDSRLAKKPFKPSAKAISAYVVKDDIKVDMSDEDLTLIRQQVQERVEKLAKGSHYPSKSLLNAFARICDPDSYDFDGNTAKEISYTNPDVYKPRHPAEEAKEPKKN